MRFLLIPGAGGDAWFWHRVVPPLRAAGHRAVAVELPAADDAAGLPEYVAAAIRAAEALGDDDVPLVVVGQSLGGFSAPTVAGRMGATRIMLVNAMIPQPGETAGDWWRVTGQAAAQAENDAREGRPPGGDLDPTVYFLHDVPAEVMATSPGESQQSTTVFEGVFPGWPDIPVRVLSGRDDRFFPLEFQRRVARDRLGRDVEVVPGGHCAALSYPQELAAALLA